MQSKIVKTLQDFYALSKQDPRSLSEDEKFFAYNIEFDLAKSIVQELGKKPSKALAEIILAYVNK